MASKHVLFAQANLGKGRCATPEFRQRAVEEGVRIALIQEPYQYMAKFVVGEMLEL